MPMEIKLVSISRQFCGFFYSKVTNTKAQPLKEQSDTKSTYLVCLTARACEFSL